MGISYLTAVLEEKGYHVDVVDCQTTHPTQQELEEKFRSLQSDIVGVTAATLTYNPALEILRAAKTALPKAVTMIGGPHVTVMDKQTFQESNNVDVVVRSEGEQTMLELAALISAGNRGGFGDVLGITYRQNGKVIQNGERPFMQNIDLLPHPAHKHFDIGKYRILNKTYLPIITSRGCPFHCTFCAGYKMCGRGFRARSPTKVVDELEWLRDDLGGGAFAFYDDTFTFDVPRAVAICDEMRKRKFDLPWDCRTRVDKVSPSLMAKLHSAGCELVHFGVESGSQQMLNLMRKGTTVEQNAQAIKWAKEAGVSVAISLVIGYPTETAEQLQQTIDFIFKTKPDYVYMCEAVPYPGTELYEFTKGLGLDLAKDWSLYHEQTQVFENKLLPLETLNRTKKEFYDRYLSYSFFIRKKMKGDFYSQIMARSALNHLVANNRAAKWAIRHLYHPKVSPGGHSTPSKEQQK
jgi:anaerobic magnesium-protoporphyrin IX monomethyl ester cyclase